MKFYSINEFLKLKDYMSSEDLKKKQLEFALPKLISLKMARRKAMSR